MPQEHRERGPGPVRRQTLRGQGRRRAFDARDVRAVPAGRAAIREAAVAEEMRVEMEARVATEKRRAEALATEAGSVEKLRSAKEHIVERILTLACPRCTQAFVDFEGCFALNCGRCRAAFCAYCLADCGRDAHAHVGTCAEGKDSLKQSGGSANRRIGGHPATVYGTKAMFDVAQKRRRCKHLALFLERHDETTRARLLREIEPELRDLGITPADVARSAKKQSKDVEKADKAAAAQRARQQGGRGGGGAPGAERGIADARGRAAMGRAMEMAAMMFARGLEGAARASRGPGGRARRKGPFRRPPAGAPGRRHPGPRVRAAPPAKTRPASSGRCGASARSERRQREEAEQAARDARAARRAGVGNRNANNAHVVVENVDLVSAEPEPRRAAPAPARRGRVATLVAREKRNAARIRRARRAHRPRLVAGLGRFFGPRGRARAGAPRVGAGGDEVVDLT